jgi:hypothetical protein
VAKAIRNEVKWNEHLDAIFNQNANIKNIRRSRTLMGGIYCIKSTGCTNKTKSITNEAELFHQLNDKKVERILLLYAM